MTLAFAVIFFAGLLVGYVAGRIQPKQPPGSDAGGGRTAPGQTDAN